MLLLGARGTGSTNQSGDGARPGATLKQFKGITQRRPDPAEQHPVSWVEFSARQEIGHERPAARRQNGRQPHHKLLAALPSPGTVHEP